MTVGADNHVWRVSQRPDTDEEFLILSEMAGFRAEDRSIMIQNSTDADVVVAICVIPADMGAPYAPQMARVHVKAEKSVVVNKHGCFPRQESVAPGFLSGALAGIELWLTASTVPTTGTVYCEIGCHYDS